ncbi:ATP-binding protein [Nocardioides sp.]|uniref:ATP-binding protein n=1 Tax=Nocardioides sp. TaxID=35761 RepID=UPI00286BA6E6|nr:ATP-binding protein [Nocardioides sp.]
MPPSTERVPERPVQPAVWPGGRRSVVLPVTAATLALVFALGFWSVVFAPSGSQVAAWWPAAGVSAALVALSPQRSWVSLALALVAVTGTANIAAGRPLLVALCFGVANATEAVVIAWSLGAARERPALRSTADMRRLVAASVLGGLTIGLLASLTVTLLEDGAFLVTWERVLASHVAGVLIVLPVALLVLPGVSPGIRWREWRGSASALEAGAQVIATLAVVSVVFSRGQDRPFVYLCLPFLVWLALRLPPWAVALEILAIATLVNVLIHEGGGPFISSGAMTPETSAVLVQSFLVVCVVVAMPLALSLQERRETLTDLRRSGGDLQVERDFTAAVLDSTDSLIVVVDPAGRIVRANAAVERISGLALSRLVGSAYDEALLMPGAAARFRHTFLSGGEPTGDGPDGVEHQVWRSPSGQARAVTASSRPLHRDDPTGPVVITGRDITEQLETQGLLRSILDATTATAVIGTDTEGVITFFNAGAEAMLGFSSVEMVDRETPARFHLESEVVERARELAVEPGFEVFVHEVRRTGVPERRDWTYLRRDGTTIVVSLTVSARTDVDGTIHGYLGIAADVTERRRAEESLRTALEHERLAVARLHELDRIKTDFVSSTSHELRTPLTSVLGFSQLLATEAVGPVNQRQRALLSRIEKSGRRLLDLVENLLTLASLESGELDLRKAAVDLREVVVIALETLEETLRGRDLTLELDLGADPVGVWGDQDQLERAVINLLSNAIKFTDDGGRVEVSLTHVGDEARLRVGDTGMGIPLEEQDRLFSRFFRASSATAAAVPGTGLGLSIVHAIVEAHDGSIEVTSTPDVGTTFVVHLPTSQEQAEPAA